MFRALGQAGLGSRQQAVSLFLMTPVCDHRAVALIFFPLQTEGINCAFFLKRVKDRNRVSIRGCSSSSGLLLHGHRDPCPDGRPPICAETNSSNSPLCPIHGKTRGG